MCSYSDLMYQKVQIAVGHNGKDCSATATFDPEHGDHTSPGMKEIRGKMK